MAALLSGHRDFELYIYVYIQLKFRSITSIPLCNLEYDLAETLSKEV